MMVYQKIRELRIRNGMSQSDLAHKVGVSARAVFDWEKGAKPRPRQLAKLSQLFCISITALLDESGLPAKKPLSKACVYLRKQAVALRELADNLERIADHSEAGE